MNVNINQRQIHLDFHTSDLIPDVGKHFDAEKFASTLQEANVNSITCFARCHHGNLYYKSEIHADHIHKNLAIEDLLGKQIAACHSVGIKVPIYTPIQWDQKIATLHPEWLMRNQDGSVIVNLNDSAPTAEQGFYSYLCVNTEYAEFIKEETVELLNKYDVDGLFYDIVRVKDCSCDACVGMMKEKGIDYTDKAERIKFYTETLNKFREEMSGLVRSINPEATVYYNTSHIFPDYREFIDTLSHVEVESLPSGEWGYDHYPVIGRYSRMFDMPVLSMTGKFQTSWGDFHSFKNLEALEYECFLPTAFNTACSIGDQMHPDGTLSETTYNLIGQVYNKLEEAEAYIIGAEALVEIGLFNTEECFAGLEQKEVEDPDLISKSLTAASNILQDSGFQFDVIDSTVELSKYKLLVFPDDYRLSAQLTEKVNAFMATGGKVLMCGMTPFNDELSSALIPGVGVNPKGRITHKLDYFKRTAALEHLQEQGIPEEELVMYSGSVEVSAEPGSTVLGEAIAPYFDREGTNFCSHRQTPSSRKVIHPSLVATEQSAYFGNPVFEIYADKGARWIRTLVADQCNALLGKPLVKHNGPKSLITTVNKQESHGRYVIHLLNYVPESKCRELLIVDSKPVVNNLTLTLTLADVKEVIPTDELLQLEDVLIEEDSVTLTIKEFQGYQIIELPYKSS
ncbi:alpha-amylase family protein [Thaumasiovibrio sp. DFM-14]|uniref:alpha-amylase family protein n=1 Tax=Thaumasiovibrio sp. DFM-14 TaxID=3384792 RepID=UPI0039A0F482